MDSFEKEDLSGIKTVMSVNIPVEYFTLIKHLSDTKKMSKSEFVANAVRDYILKVRQA